MDAEDFFIGLLVVVCAGTFVALMAVTTLFFISIGVWPIVAWGWFGVIVLGSGVGMLANS